MPRAPVHRMKKVDIVRLSRWRCKHGETGLSHYNCYITENPDLERVCFLDLECSNLSADFGIILSYAIADEKSDTIYSRIITKRELQTCLDKKIVENCLKDLKNFDRVVTYYGSNFDIPFLRTRAVALGIPFFEFGELIHNDLYYTIRNRFKLSRNRLDNACMSLLGNTEKTRITAEYWIKALMGDPQSLAYILDHNIKDVQELKRLYQKVLTYRKKTDTSL